MRTGQFCFVFVSITSIHDVVARDTVIISQHEVVHRGHTHLHSHAHSAPSSISSVAIMVGAVQNLPIIIMSYLAT